jgi:UDP-N-acetylmuramoyl-L-alanyl-D-glutamate--2,6-diaminopimelate ligase
MMMASVKEDQNKIQVLDRREAISLAVASAEDGDCVIILGKGHETGQEVAGIVTPFDDRIELAKAIGALS